MIERRRIEASELIDVRLSHDGSRLLLTMRDQGGASVSLFLPTMNLNTILAALPGPPETGVVHPLDGWSIRRAENGGEYLLTLRTAEGRSISFATKPWQMEGMATLTAHGGLYQVQPKRLH